MQSNRVRVEPPLPKSNHDTIQQGQFWADGTGRIFVASYRGIDAGLSLVELANGCRVSDSSPWGDAGPEAYQRLPPGTVVTITVGG